MSVLIYFKQVGNLEDFSKIITNKSSDSITAIFFVVNFSLGSFLINVNKNKFNVTRDINCQKHDLEKNIFNFDCTNCFNFTIKLSQRSFET